MSDLLNALAQIYQQQALDDELRNLWRRDVPYPARFSSPFNWQQILGAGEHRRDIGSMLMDLGYQPGPRESDNIRDVRHSISSNPLQAVRDLRVSPEPVAPSLNPLAALLALPRKQ